MSRLYGASQPEIQLHDSVGLSSTANPKPKGQPSISLPAQANLTEQKADVYVPFKSLDSVRG